VLYWLAVTWALLVIGRGAWLVARWIWSPPSVYETRPSVRGPAPAPPRPSQKQAPSPPAVRVARSEIVDDEDDGYSAFVEECWALPMRECGHQPLMVNLKSVRAVGVIERNGRLYLNAIEDGTRLTFGCFNDHRWEIDGQRFDGSAFIAAYAGVPLREAALEPRPRTLSEACERDHGPPDEPRFAMRYRGGDGEESWRVISRPQAGRLYLRADDHFRWGQRRTYSREGVLDVIDLQTGEVIDLFRRRSGSRKGATEQT